jgi:hypothetical protein
MAIKYINIFLSLALQNLPNLGFFGLKRNRLATLLSNGDDSTRQLGQGKSSDICLFVVALPQRNGYF